MRSMPEPSEPKATIRRLVMLITGWVMAAALYLLLIDITDLPELIVGAGAAVLAATGFELARERRAVPRARPHLLARAYRPVLMVPSDLVRLTIVLFRQLRRPRDTVGEFRTAPFRTMPEEEGEIGRRALTESLGSFSPNTIIIGVDGDRQVVLAHQLQRRGGAEAIDMLGLG